MTNKEKLDHFTASILSDAGALSDQILEEIKKTREEALRAAQDAYLTEIYGYIRNQVAAIQVEEGQSVSKKVMECKRALYARRAQIEQSIASELRERVTAYTRTPEYEAALEACCREAAPLLSGAPCVVYVKKDDLPKAERLCALLPAGTRVEQGEIELGGMILESPSRHLRVDETYDTLFSEKTEHLTELLQLGFSE